MKACRLIRWTHLKLFDFNNVACVQGTTRESFNTKNTVPTVNHRVLKCEDVLVHHYHRYCIVQVHSGRFGKVFFEVFVLCFEIVTICFSVEKCE